MPHEHDEITEVRTERVEPGREQRVFTFKFTQLIWLLLGILEVLLALRILLKLIAANPNSPIASLIYSFTDLFLVPFAGLTPTPSAGGMVLEISTIFAMIIYALIGWAIERVIWLLFYRPREPMVEVTESHSHEDTTHHHH
jgi:YGGT family